jgi:hypothetical protein
MKNKLRAIIALLKSRAYLDSQGEVAERKLRPGDDSHHEYELRQTPIRNDRTTAHRPGRASGLGEAEIKKC